VARTPLSGRPRAWRRAGRAGSTTRDGPPTAAGGTIVSANKDIGLATVRSTRADFMTDVRRQSVVDGAAENRVVGKAPKDTSGAVRKGAAVETEGRDAGRGKSVPKASGELLSGAQWDMKQIHATADGSYRVEPGDRRVLVGVIDTGIDGTHPDIAPNFDRALSRNFTTDIPVDANGAEVDGPCEHPSCVDPVDEDDDGHGTHVASTIASPLNGLGMAGVAPGVTLVNVRAGQDSGSFFLQPVVDALTYSADVGIDVVNMSFYIDPWLFNCVDNPADSPEPRAEQRTVIQATERALAYAHRHGVTLVSAAGNGATDYTKTIIDDSSPDYPAVPGEAPYERTIPPRCISEPSEGQNVIAVSAIAPDLRKSYYSDYGNGYVTVSAPGGDAYDSADQKVDPTKEVLAAYPESLAEKNGDLNPDGTLEHPLGRPRLQGHGLRLVPVPAGHLDGLAAHRRRRRPHRQPLRPPGSRTRWADAVPGRGQGHSGGHGHQAPLPHAACVHLHAPGQTAGRRVPDGDRHACL
jgi:subtilisin family serine protease